MFTDNTPPTEAAYRDALTKRSANYTQTDMRILAFHYSQPGRAMTSHQLAHELGYGGKIAPSNSAYGRLGHKMADAIGFDPQSTATDRRGWWRAISTGDYSGDHFVWYMRSQLADALVSSGLVDPHVDGSVSIPDLDIAPEMTIIEGRLLLRSHLARERSRSLITAKKASAANLSCEICGFSSLQTYGVDFCEVHHLLPIASLNGLTPTRLEDLAIVCANCHRIIHLVSPPLKLDEVRTRIRTKQ